MRRVEERQTKLMNEKRFKSTIDNECEVMD